MRQLFVHFVQWIVKSRMGQLRNAFAMLLFVLPMFCGDVMAQQFTISQIPATAVVGDIVDLDVTISNADSMVSFQYTHEWDSTRIRFIGQNSTNLPSASGFAVFQPQEDKLTVSWNNTNGRFDNITPAGNATATRIIYKLRFLIRSLSPAPWLRFTGDPTPVDLTRSGGRNVVPTFNSLGTPPFVNYAALNISTISQSVQPGQQVCIDVTAQNFNNLVKAQWGMKWDSSVLRFESVSTAGLPNTTSIANSNFNTTRAVANGELGFSWTPASAGSRTVTDGTVLFRLCFTAIGANGTSSLLRTLSLTDSPFEVIRFNVIDANQRVPLTPQNGTVTVSNTGGGVPIVGLGFLADQISATTGSEIGVRIRTVNFQNVAAAQWSMHFDSTKLTYLGVCPMPTGVCDGTETWELPGLTADNFFSPTSGTLRFAWFSLTARNVAKPDSTTLFTIRFRVTGAACTNSPVTFNGTPLRVLITDEAGTTRTQTFVSGNVSVPCSAAAIVASGSTTNATCNGGGNGAIALTVSGGTGTFTYAWTGPNGFTSVVQNPTNLRAGTYNVVITSGTQTNNQSFVITEPTIISGVQTITNVACFGASTGAISVATTGGAGSYTYSWTGPNSFTASTQNITGLATGSYVFTIRDGAGCSVTSLPLLVSQPASALTVGSPTVTNVGCFGGNNGAISVAGTGGTAPYTYSWTGTNAFTSSSQNISNLSAGNYTVTVRDANGCTVSSTAISVSQPASLPNIGSPTVTNLTCGGTTGSIVIAPSGGTAPYTFAWTGPNSFTASTQNISNLSAGDYTVVVRDANGCSMTSGAITVTQPASAVSIGSTSVTNISCFGGNTGAVNVTITGGVAPYVFSWTGFNGFTASTQNISNLLAGSYTLNIRDANGCSITSQAIVVMQPTAALAIGTPSVQNIACFGNSTGGIVIAPSGGTSPYTYAWTGAGGFTSAFQSVSNLAAGSYTVVVRDANNCTVTSNLIPVTQPTTPPSIGTPSVTNVACAGASTGGIVISPSGGTPSYSYSWAGPNGFTATAQNISNLAAGDYVVTIRDANGCAVTSGNITVSQPTNGVAVGSPTVVNVGCFGGNNGSITISPSGGTAPFTYSWTGVNGFTSSNQNISSLSAGSYTVVVRDANGCAVTSNAISVLQPTNGVAVGSPTVVNVGCFGGNNGSIAISPSGGTAPFTYSWTGVNGFTSSNQNISNLLAGNYTVVVRDANGCTVTSTAISVSQPTNGVAVGSPTVVNVGCFGGNNGSITISPSGGTAPFTYSWTGVNGFTSSNQNISNLLAGSYTVVVRDANGCSVTSNAISVSQPTNGVAVGSPTVVNVGCFGGNNGSIAISPSGGTAPFTYSWTGANGFTSSNQNISNLLAGNYTVVVRDANGCTVTSNAISVAQPTAITISTPTIAAARCGQSNGSISVNVSGGTGGYAYLWSNASTNAILSNVGAGQYSVVVTDGNGCSVTSPNYTVTGSSAAFTFSTSPTVTNATCGQNNGAISSVSITGGVAPYTYAWAGPNGFTSTSQNLSSLAAGNYILTARDANGCETVLAAVNVASAGSTLSIGVPSATNVLCNGGSTGAISVTISGGVAPLRFSWTGSNGFTSSNQNLTGLSAGTYSLVVTDANGCTASSNNISVSQPTTPPSIGTPSVTNVGCFGGSTGAITIAPSGGTAPFTYSWTGANGFTSSNQNISNLSVGNYTVVVRDANGCSVTSTAISVSQPTNGVAVGSPTVVNVGCFGGNNGSITISPSGGTAPFTYAWTGVNGFTSSNQNISNLLAGNYTVVVRDANGCTVSSGNISVTQSAATLSVFTSNVVNVGCFGALTGSISVSPSGGTAPFTYSWTGVNGFTSSNQNISSLSAGNYTVVVRDANGCTVTSNAISVSQPAAAFAVGSPTVVNVGCFGGNNGSIAIAPSGGTAPFTYSWTGVNGFTSSNQNISSLLAGNYTVVVRDANGCSVTSNAISVSQPAASVSVAATPTAVRCNGASTGAISIVPSGGTPNYTYSWSGVGGFVSTNQNIANLRAGSYIVTVTDANGCAQSSTPVVIGEPSLLTISSPTIAAARCGQSNGSISVNVSGGTGGYTYLWSNGATNAILSNIGAGQYSVVVTDGNGCTMASTNYTVTSTSAAFAFSASPTVTNATCGQNNGAISSVSITGGVAPYTYAWAGPNGFTSTSQNLSSLAAGNYILTARDANGCETVLAAVNVASAGSTLSIGVPSATNVLCNGGSTGAISVTVSGGVAPLRFSWTGSNGFTSSNQNLTGLSAGTYSLVVTDANGCTASSNNISVSQPATAITIAAQPTTTSVKCFGGNDGAISVTPSGGTGGYTYTWSQPTIGNTANATGLTAGTYGVTVRDVNGCQVSATGISVAQPALPLTINFTVRDANGAANGEIDVTVTGGTQPYRYAWTGAGVCASCQNPRSLAPGTYTVVVTDANNCTVTQQIQVRGTTVQIVLTNSTVSNAGCVGANAGGVAITFVGGTAPFAFEWRDSARNIVVSTSQDLSGIGAGTYSLKITDALGQIFNSPTYRVLGGTAPVRITANTVGNETCTELGRIDISITGGTGNYTILWSNGNTSEDLTNIRRGAYSVTVRDNAGCTTTANFTVNYVPCPLVVTRVVRNLRCAGDNTGAIVLTISGGDPVYRIRWTGARTDSAQVSNAPARGGVYEMANLLAGSYSIRVIDANGQEIVVSEVVTEPNPIRVVGTIAPDNGACNGSVTLTVSGGTGNYSYLWSDNSTGRDIFNLCGNISRTVTVRDERGCTGTATFTIPRFERLRVLDTAIISPRCSGDSTGSIRPNWVGGTRPFTFIWRNEQNVVVGTDSALTRMPSGRYFVTATDRSTPVQTITAIFVIASPANPLIITDLQLSSATPNNADGGAVVTVSGGTQPYNFTWCNGNNTGTVNRINNLRAGACGVSVTDAQGCRIIRNFDVTVGGAVSIVAVSDYNGFNIRCNGQCNGSAIVQGVQGAVAPLTYRWSSGETSAIARALCGGLNSVTITDANGRNYQTTITLTEPLALQATLLKRDPTSAGGKNGSITVNVTGGVDPYKYRWNDPTLPAQSFVGNVGAGRYFVLVTDKNGCEILKDAVLKDSSNGSTCLTASPIITPNDDGKNDIFEVNLCGYSQVKLEIYNRFGQLEYDDENYANNWTGLGRNGRQLPNGGYFYILKATTSTGSTQLEKGTVTIMREER